MHGRTSTQKVTKVRVKVGGEKTCRKTAAFEKVPSKVYESRIFSVLT